MNRYVLIWANYQVFDNSRTFGFLEMHNDRPELRGFGSLRALHISLLPEEVGQIMGGN